MELIYISKKDLVRSKKNTRKHSKDQIEAIKNSIAKFGFYAPVVIDEHNRVLAGHGRIDAVEKDFDVPCVRIENLTETEKNALMIADNRIFEMGETNYDMIKQLEEEDEKLAIALKGLIEIDWAKEKGKLDKEKLDDIPEEAPAIVKRGDIYRLGDHRLMCGDSTSKDDVSKLMEGKKANMVFTDPPYNVKVKNIVKSSNHKEFKMASGEMTKEEFIFFLQVVFENYVQHSTDGSIHYVCMDWKHVHEIIVAGLEEYTEYKQLVIWNKNNGGMGAFYRSKHELIFIFKNGTEKHINNFELGQTGRYRTNVWDYPISTSSQEGRDNLKLHPTVKPVALVSDAILDCSNEGMIVADLFLGSGTTLIACENTDRICYGMELDEHYCDIIIKRWEEITGKKAVKES